MTKLKKRPNELMGLLKMGLIDPSPACRSPLNQHNGRFSVTAQKEVGDLVSITHTSYQRLLSIQLASEKNLL